MAALKTKTNMVKTVRKAAIERLLFERRTTQPNAAAIFFVKNKLDAYELQEDIERSHNIKATVLTEDTQDVSETLNKFRNGTDEVIIAIRLLSEGVNVKRTRVIAHLTNTITRMSVIQMWTRGCRKETHLQKGPSYIYSLKIPELVEIARSMDTVTIHTKLKEEREGDFTGGNNSGDSSSFIPIDAEAQETTAIFRGSETPETHLKLAETVRNRSPQLYQNLSDTEIARIVLDNNPNALPMKEKVLSGETYDDVRKRLSGQITILNNRLAYQQGVEPKEVHRKWISLGGKKHEDSSNKDLEAKLNWLTSELEELARQQSFEAEDYSPAA
jgi:superfamily II DNA or RNA helicase